MRELKFAERLQRDGARVLMGSLAAYAPRLFSRRAGVVDGLTLHPEMQLLLGLRDLRGGKSWHQLSVAQARAQLRAESRLSAGAPVRVGPVREFDIEGPAGPLRVRHYAPPSLDRQPPLVVFFHGGGFVLGDLDSHDQPCRILCKYAGVQVLSVGYRLAPEHPFPAAPEDVFAAYRWARANAVGLGADPTRVAVAGDSAGGNLATAVALMAKAEGQPQPCAQLLFYPCVDRVEARPSLSLFARDYLLTRADIDWCTERYAGSVDLRHPLLSPLLAPDLRGLAPAFVVSVGFDPLRDEGEAYESALRVAGNTTRFLRVPDLIHGFINCTGVSPAAERATIDIAQRFRQLLDENRES